MRLGRFALPAETPASDSTAGVHHATQVTAWGRLCDVIGPAHTGGPVGQVPSQNPTFYRAEIIISAHVSGAVVPRCPRR